MADKTEIAWADSTFNPWMGCSKISPACDHCYAERDTKRFGRVQWGAGQPRVRTSADNWKKPLRWNRETFCECPSCGWRGSYGTPSAPRCGRCGAPATPARRRVFCASLADVFDNEVNPDWRADLFRLIEATPNLDWLLLTKRIGNAKTMMADALHLSQSANRDGMVWPLPNVWLGATICNQAEADRDIPKLLKVPAAVRFLSMEPLLGPVRLTFDDWADGMIVQKMFPVDWVIAGGESGPEARPMHPAWVRGLRDQCAAAGVPFLVKQWGEWKSVCQGDEDWYEHLYRSRRIAEDGENQDALDELYGRFCTVPTLCLRNDGKALGITEDGAWLAGTKPVQIFKVGTKSAGRLLDGVQHDGYPKGGAA